MSASGFSGTFRMEKEKICRLCAQVVAEETYNIFDRSNNGQQIVQIINQFIPIVIYRTDPLSKEICKNCHNVLQIFSTFEKQCLAAQNIFKSDLLTEPMEDNVKLYFDVLKNKDQSGVNGLTSLNSMTHTGSQTSLLETLLYKPLDGTDAFNESHRLPCLTILTPSKINELNSSASEGNELLRSRPKRAGPKSKTKVLNPLSLLQCALRKINQLMNLTGEEQTWGLEGREMQCRQSMSYTSDEEEEEDDVEDEDDVEANAETNAEAEAVDPQYCVDLNASAECNYCMKQFDNIVELSQHELQHMSVDIGPKVDSTGFSVRLKYLYADFIRRSQRHDINLKLSRYNRRTIIENAPEEEDQNSLLVAEPLSIGPFSQHDMKVFLNGVPINEVPKEQRRSHFKNIVINGVRRKFCPLCRHTFKDNWAIEHHYMIEACQYSCRFCGMKFRLHRDLFADHMRVHEGETTNRIFGPSTRHHVMRNKKKVFNNKFHHRPNMTPRIKPLKLKQMLHKKLVTPPTRVKQEPVAAAVPDAECVPQPSAATQPRHSAVQDSVTLQLNNKFRPYQAYFCRKCYKVFYHVEEYQLHVDVCTGETQEAVSSAEGNSRRPVRSCVKELSIPQYESEPEDEILPPAPKKSKRMPSKTSGYECNVCCSSFPNFQSRNSHMRIHKVQQQQQQQQQLKQQQQQQTYFKQVYGQPQQQPQPRHQQQRQLQYYQPQLAQTPPYKVSGLAPTTKGTGPGVILKPKQSDMRLVNLNPTVARLVQNNPHLTIRSYKSVEEMQPPPAEVSVDCAEMTVEIPTEQLRYFRCSDCHDRFANKSLLYYHKMNHCVVKRNYECAFCHKKFGGKEQYNNHMLYVHPE